MVHKDSAATLIDDLKGKKIGVSSATTYLDYLQGKLKLEGEEILKLPPDGAQPEVYDTDASAFADLALGDSGSIAAVLTALATAEELIGAGQPFRILGDPVYYEGLGIALDQKSPNDSKSLTGEITTIINEMHKDGTLTKLATKYYRSDLTSKK